MSTAARPALFLDRDGVINEEIGYLHQAELVRFMPGIADLIATANRLGMPVVVITNQAGIGRGFYTDAQFHTLMHAMRAALAQQGARIDAVYYSPFHPEHGMGDYRRDTDCRKPRPGMLLQAAAEHGIDLAGSVLVGDRCSDVQAGAAARLAHLFLIRGTEIRGTEIRGTEANGCAGLAYTAVDTLAEVTRWLTAHFTTDEAAPAKTDAVAS